MSQPNPNQSVREQLEKIHLAVVATINENYVNFISNGMTEKSELATMLHNVATIMTDEAMALLDQISAERELKARIDEIGRLRHRSHSDTCEALINCRKQRGPYKDDVIVYEDQCTCHVAIAMDRIDSLVKILEERNERRAIHPG